MTTKHTPGPWRYWACKVDSRANPPMYDYAQFANPNGHVFRAPLRYLREEDARLIAAAPDLLEALVMVRDADKDCKRDGLPTIPSSARAKIDAAIAATGAA